MITRIILIGPGRINEAAITLSFDNYLNPRPDKTYIISPYPQHKLDSVFAEFGLDSSNYTLLDDLYFEDYYDLSRYKHNHWYYQQALKFCAFDLFDSDYFLLQDCDQVPLKQFNFFVDGKLNFKAEPLWNPYQDLYSEMVEKITGLNRVLNFSLVNELMPYSKEDWNSLKQLIEDRNSCHWLNAFPNIRELGEPKWLSEFELLGTYKTNQSTGWTHYTAIPQPSINTWEDFLNHDWSKQDTIKFLTQPLKYMNINNAQMVLKHLKKALTNNV
jgi:hypothetical protein